MIIPLSTDLALPKRPVVMPILVVLTIAIHLGLFGLAQSDPAQAQAVVDFGHIQGGAGFRWWGLFTSAFLHGGWMHLAGNMVFLWVFGPSVESRFGRLGFLAFYLTGAAISGGAHAMLEVAPAIGASGAIAAVTGSFIVLFPQTRIKCLWLIGFAIMHAPAWWVIGLGVVWSIFAAGIGVDSGVAHMAHLGGYVWGIGLTMLLIWIKVFPRQPYDLFTAMRQAKRRHDLRSAAAHARTPEKVARRHDEPANPQADAIASARASIAEHLEAGHIEVAAAEYKAMFAQYEDASMALRTLPRDMQYAIATNLFARGQYNEAVGAFVLLIEMYPSDTEVDQIRILIARAYTKYLGRMDDAASLLDLVIESAKTDAMRDLARRERAAIEHNPTT